MSHLFFSFASLSHCYEIIMSLVFCVHFQCFNVECGSMFSVLKLVYLWREKRAWARLFTNYRSKIRKIMYLELEYMMLTTTQCDLFINTVRNCLMLSLRSSLAFIVKYSFCNFNCIFGVPTKFVIGENEAHHSKCSKRNVCPKKAKLKHVVVPNEVSRGAFTALWFRFNCELISIIFASVNPLTQFSPLFGSVVSEPSRSLLAYKSATKEWQTDAKYTNLKIKWNDPLKRSKQQQQQHQQKTISILFRWSKSKKKKKMGTRKRIDRNWGRQHIQT